MPTDESPRTAFSRLEEFNEYFELSLAMSRKQRDKVYRIRYRVYCEEFGYEPTAFFGNHQEMDEFDCQSIHCLVTHRDSGLAAGCVRTVMVEDNDRLPMEVHAGDAIDQRFIERFRDRRDTLCEISRLAVDGRFRRRRREAETRFGDTEGIDFRPGERRTFPLIAMALILGAGAVADILGRKNCFAIMEPSLPIMMRRAGIDFRRVGADFQFRGVRAPYYGNIDDLVDSAPPELRLYFYGVRERFAASLHSTLMVPSPPDPGAPVSVVMGGRNRLPWWLKSLGEGVA